MKVNDMRTLERAENTMLRWMSCVTMKDKKRTAELLDWFGVVLFWSDWERGGKLGRLRWYEHVEHKDNSDWVSTCRNLQVKGTGNRSTLLNVIIRV